MRRFGASPHELKSCDTGAVSRCTHFDSYVPFAVGKRTGTPLNDGMSKAPVPLDLTQLKVQPLASRLLAIHEGLATVLGDFRPMEAAVEQTFVNKDGVATLKLGQARGVAMLAPAMFGITVAEYAPNQVKKTVVGAGHADKNQIAVMLKILLPKADPKSPDAADALAIAITHAHHRASVELRLKVAGA